MKMLSEEKIKELAKKNSDMTIDSKRRYSYDFCTGGLFNFARAIEAAVLEEQAKAGPVLCVAIDDLQRLQRKHEGDAHIKAWLPPMAASSEVALYLHPSPAPEGIVLVPRDSALPYLANLVEALDGAFISSWQSTAAWQKQLDAARDYINNVAEKP